MKYSLENLALEPEHHTANSLDFRIYQEAKNELSERERGAFEKFVPEFLAERPDPEKLLADFKALNEYRMRRQAMRQKQETAQQKLRQDPDRKISYLRAKITEAVLWHLLGKRRLFGDDFTLDPTSEYDDWINGADLVLKTESRTEPLAITVDVVNAQDREIIRGKIRIILDGIDKETLGKLDYAYDRKTGAVKEHRNIPKIILGIADEKLFVEMLELALRGKLSQLATHPALYMLIEELRAQAEHLQKYAQRHAPKNSEATKKYQELQAIAEQIYDRFTKKVTQSLQQKFPGIGEHDLEKALQNELHALQRAAQTDPVYKNLNAILETLAA